MRPCVGFNPYTPQYEAGRIVDPPVWLPSASGTMPAATAAADPLDDPPGVCPGLCGFRVLPGWRVANSVVTVLPMMTAPAPRSIATTLASRAGVRPACRTDPFSVGISAVSMMSLIPTGTPCRAPIGCPESRTSSLARACAITYSGSRNVHACTVGSTSRILARHASTSWTDVMTPSRTSCAACVADSRWRLVTSMSSLPRTSRRRPPRLHLDEHAPQDLARRRLRNRIDEFEVPDPLVRGHPP